MSIAYVVISKKGELLATLYDYPEAMEFARRTGSLMGALDIVLDFTDVGPCVGAITELTTEQKYSAFARALEVLASSGTVEPTLNELRYAYAVQAGEGGTVKRWFFYEMISRFRGAGQLEIIGYRGGRYRITGVTTPASVPPHTRTRVLPW